MQRRGRRRAGAAGPCERSAASGSGSAFVLAASDCAAARATAMAPTTATISSAVASSNGTMAFGEQLACRRPRPCRAGGRRGRSVVRLARRRAQHEHQRDAARRAPNSAAAEVARAGARRSRASLASPRVGAEQHDHEHEQHDDRAGVDDQLDRREELRVQRQEQARDADDGQRAGPSRRGSGSAPSTVHERADQGTRSAHSAKKTLPAVIASALPVCERAAGSRRSPRTPCGTCARRRAPASPCRRRRRRWCCP